MMRDAPPLVLDRGLRRDDEIEVEITDVTERGLGRGYLDTLIGPDRHPKRYDIFVRKAVPGDILRVRIENARRGRLSGGWIEMIQPSRIRIPARCPHFGRREQPKKGCGGCTLQSMSYRHQLAIKERMIKDRMKEAGVDPGLVLPLKGMDEPWYYRNKMEFSFGDDANRDFALGLYPTGYKFETLNLDVCYLQSKFVSAFVPKVRQWAIDRGLQPFLASRREGFLKSLIVREGKRTGERLVELMTTDADSAEMEGTVVEAEAVARAFQQFCESFGQEITSLYWTTHRVQKGSPTSWTEKLLAGRERLTEELRLPGDRSLRFEIHPRAFFQPNTKGAELLYAEVIEKAGLTSENSAKTVLDLYCGTGTIGLCMAPFAEQVYGIEMQPDAVENARRNARKNGITNIEFFPGDVGKVLKNQQFIKKSNTDSFAIDLVIVDPPRSGLFVEAVEQILAIGAPRLVYVSCNPKSLAKNLKQLEVGGYEIEVIQPVDLFPQTFHVENVALLRRR